MTIRLVRCPRTPPFPIWAVALVLAWGALVAAAYVLQQRSGLTFSTCLLKQTTGLPCPLCGGTRVVVRAAGGDLWSSFASNPGLFVALLLAGAWLCLRVVAARRVDLGLGARGRRAALVVGVALLLANWAYLIVNGI